MAHTPLARHTAAHHPLIKHTRGFVRGFRANLELATLLAFVAGIVNTVGYLEFGTYVSHISGHATRTAVEYTEGNTAAALVFFLEVVAFILGAMVTAILLHGHTASDRRQKASLPIVMEAGLILLFILVDQNDGLGQWVQFDHISLTTLILAHAMGMQNALLRHASGAIIRTTHMTGIATDIGVAMGTAIHAARIHHLHRKQSSTSSWLGVLENFWVKLGAHRFAFHCLLLFGFFLGAVVGTIGYIYIMSGILSVPVVILLVLALQEHGRKVKLNG